MPRKKAAKKQSQYEEEALQDELEEEEDEALAVMDEEEQQQSEEQSTDLEEEARQPVSHTEEDMDPVVTRPSLDEQEDEAQRILQQPMTPELRSISHGPMCRWEEYPHVCNCNEGYEASHR